MSLTLILMRHAKSDWGTPGLDDFDRPLNERGRKSARAISDWLLSNGHHPDEVVVSGARRTVDTWGQMVGAMPETAVMVSEPALYMASAESILKVLKVRKERTVMLICHNPGIASFAGRIVMEPPDHPRFADYPTAAIAIIEFDADEWGSVVWGSGRVTDFTVPRDLRD